MKTSSILRIISLLLLVTTLAVGCASAPVVSDADLLSTVVAQTLTAVPPTVPPPTLVPSQVVTDEPATVPATSSTPEAAGVRYVYTDADNVNLRVLPGTLFKVSRVMPKGSRLQLVGVAPGGDWLNVVNDEGIHGWVGADLVKGGFDGPPPPTVTPQEVITVSGRVTDVNGNPISGIGFAVIQKTGNGTSRGDGMTDETGTFYVFLPITAYGNWSVEFVSVSCKSNTMDANCQCLNNVCGKPDPQTIEVSLPLPAPLSFTWKQ
ncbi:MAG: SH3 domain-containing protein [Chloroflexi bacterium]|nr:SH3 domain-containing protein [Chloroflexota bacterium]